VGYRRKREELGRNFLRASVEAAYSVWARLFAAVSREFSLPLR